MVETTNSRWVMVTGSTGALGRAVAAALVHAGYHVLVAARDLDGLGQPSPFVRPIRLDLTDSVSIREAAKDVQELCAEQGLHGLVHNADVVRPAFFEDQRLSDIREQIEVSVLGPLELTWRLLPCLRAARGRLVVISSAAERFGASFSAVHAGTKLLLEGWADSLRAELGRSAVSVVLVQPEASQATTMEQGRQVVEARLRHLAETLWTLCAAPLERLGAALAAHIRQGTPPEIVANAVVTALVSARPRTRYVIGTRARPPGPWLPMRGSRRSRQSLQYVSAHLLRDVGLAPPPTVREVARPNWNAPDQWLR